jgi:signal transduction histidine kinase
MTEFRHRLDPRLHLAAAIGWAVGLLTLLTAALTATFVLWQTRTDLEADSAALFASETSRLADSIDTALQDKLRTISASASLLDAADRSLPDTYVDRLTQAEGRSVPGFDWVGVVSAAGLVEVDSDGSKGGADVGAQPWFATAHRQVSASIGNVTAGDPPSLVIAAPLLDDKGQFAGALVGRIVLDWFLRIMDRGIGALSLSNTAESALVTGEGRLLVGSWALPEGKGAALLAAIAQEAKSPETGTPSGALRFNGNLVGYSRVAGWAAASGSEMWVLTHETSPTAFSKALDESWRIFAIIMASGAVTAVGSYLLADFLLRRLREINRTAILLRQGQADGISVPRGHDEIASVGASLSLLFDGLKTSNLELRALNRELDLRVDERTREVFRLSEEARRAAVTRDRLRMSRDLHDTLAHSMLAVLAQIKMVRKLARAKPERLPQELAETERIAQEGLNLARETVGRLRYIAVLDDGLGAALQTLVRRLQERIVIDFTLDIDPALAGMANPAAETIYRIAREALVNIEKHSDARNGSISIRLGSSNGSAGDQVEMTIRDDGRGFEHDAIGDGHYGLVGLHEQAALIAGRVTVVSRPGGGTEITLVAPL